jgi:hypothetical protein
METVLEGVWLKELRLGRCAEDKTRDWICFFILSLLLVILTCPLLDHDDMRRRIFGVVMLVPVILATVRMSPIRARVWQPAVLMSGTFIFAVADTFLRNQTLAGTTNAAIVGGKAHLVQVVRVAKLVHCFEENGKATCILPAVTEIFTTC